ncbi:transglycosylase domain-containing protein [Jeotgalibaca caeni]|uniref:transglycosylase domain-containing protein n=1 Tax=Jeotgalibaca caeni TaxID=3028623 RepID=UPI00237D90E9|nr:transglycosylase domain-containing protein [Jeotgalibaca caeni]MDE1547828.1 transglycosylase domain-containing protein [Jeotgalibaca caeni]
MNNSNGKNLNGILTQIKSFFNKFYSKVSMFFKQLFSDKNVSKTKRSAHQFEQQTHNQFDKVKRSARRHQKNGLPKTILTKGLYGFNIAYGVVRTTVVTLVVLLSLIAFLGLGTGMGYFAALVSEETPPSEMEMAQAIGNVELVSSLHYNNGELISEVRTDLQRTVTQRDQISQVVVDALVSTEDEYFYEHNGVVPKAILRALITELTGMGETTGGSTLTQQLIKQQLLTDEVTFSRKVNEILLAMRLENYFDKEDIITAYLNVSPFGRNSSGANIAGIEEAAQGIFGVSSKDVTLPQAAFLVGLPQNPYVYTPYSVYGEKNEDFSDGIARMKTVLTRMFEEQKITEEEYQAAMDYDITQDFIDAKDPNQDRHNFLYQQVEKQTIEILMTLEAEQNGLTFDQIDADVDLYNDYYFRNQNLLNTSGYKVYSTIDKTIYNAMQEAVGEYAPNLGPSYTDIYTDPETGETTEILELAQTGSVLLENETGRILGFIGGVDFSVDQNDHAFDTPRSVASTIKPLAVYAPAIEMNLISPATRLADSPMGPETAKYTEDGTPWQVSNVGNIISNKLVTAREALYQSMNNPTAKLYIEMLENGSEPYKFMDMMDFEYIDDTKTVPAFSLGAGNATVQEQTTAFATFANQGQYVPSYLIEKIEDKDGNIVYQHEEPKRDVFSPQTAYLTVDILRDVVDQGFSRNIKGYLNFDADLAAKTGTSEFNDNYWFIASTPKVTMSTWIGYNNFAAKHTFYDPYFTGGPSLNNMQWWATIANKVHTANPEVLGVNETHPQPEGIIEAQYVESTGTLPGKVTIPGTNTAVTVDGQKATDLFKADNPPRAITYDFVPGANDNDLKTLFWNPTAKKAKDAEDKKKQEAAQKKKAEEQKKLAEEKKKQEEARKKQEEEKKKQEQAEKEKNEG